MSPVILAIETATEACSAALYFQGDIVDRHEVVVREHAQRILPLCDELLREAGLTPAKLDAVAFGCGPGSFTGVRLAAAVTQGIALAHHLPVIPVSTLAALAQEAYAQYGVSRVLAAIDARMQEVYWGAYQTEDNLMQLVGEISLAAPENISLPEKNAWFGAGSAWKMPGGILRERSAEILHGLDADLRPSARAVAALALPRFLAGEGVVPSEALPHYVRNKVV